MRVAWFSPLPPDRSGIAAYCAELLPQLASRHEIEAFVDDGDGRPGAARVEPIAGVRVRGAHDFPWRYTTQGFDVCVYQLGNELCHDYIWPYMVRYPGLVVIHDGQLHHARAAGLIGRGRLNEYRAEFSYCHPRAPRALHEVVISGLGDAVRSLYYDHPMVRIPVEAGRVVAVHNRLLAEELSEVVAGAKVIPIRQGVRDLTTGETGHSEALRAMLGIPEQAVVFVAFGRATPEKRLSAVVKALGQIKVSGLVPEPWLLCVGGTADYYDVRRDAASSHVADRVVVTGYVPDGELGRYLALADACLCLRWPTGRETSASWLRCLAAGKPTVISELAHLTEVPVIDPRSMATLAVGDRPPADREPIALIVELTDEVQMLKLAIRRLAESRQLREQLGSAARRYWSRHATIEIMAQDYEALLERTRTSEPNPHPRWPAHLVVDGTKQARAIASHMGVKLDWL
ncbi:MAG: glycosyltransferase family 4 protein [Acidobacteria bacterium]|nr:glycosyltransferase family 4 protein [Acidobacteriota bacterium]